MKRLLLVFAIGCGGGGIGIDDLPEEIVGAQCDYAVACDLVEDRATCNASVSADSEELRAIQAAVDDGTVKYDSGKAADCADSIGDTNCGFEGLHVEDPCDSVFTGTVPTGGACVIDLQCANGGECVVTGACDPETMCCPGTCMGTVTESPIGGPCDDDMHFCSVTDAYCKPPAAGPGPGTCTALIPNLGATCEEIDACANPMYCNLNFQTGAGTCARPAKSGETCVRADILPCDDSRDHCDPTTLKCVRDVAVGATCGAGVQCVGYATCVNGACVADIPAGGACMVETGADCAGALECIGGVCALEPVDGMTCTLP
jgi:hypothetical protein